MDSLVLREEATGGSDTWVLGKVVLAWTPAAKGGGGRASALWRVQGESKSLPLFQIFFLRSPFPVML